jgi:hypothetical protein
LIQSKHATARPKDLLMLRELEALREMETQVQRQPGAAEARNQASAGDKQSKT